MTIEILHIDCMEYMKTCANNSFDLAVVDPPYGIDVGKQRIGSERPTVKWKAPTEYKYTSFDDSKPPDGDYFKEIFRVSKNQIVWGANYFTEHLPHSKGWIVWDKKVDIKEHLSMCELAFSSFDIKCNKFEFLWAGFKKAVQEKRNHPTQKPVALYKWILANYAKPGQRILDTHLGSGSSAIAAHYYGVDFVGCELSKHYYDLAVERIDQETRQIDMLGGAV